jgi:hypothetical protein
MGEIWIIKWAAIRFKGRIEVHLYEMAFVGMDLAF